MPPKKRKRIPRAESEESRSRRLLMKYLNIKPEKKRRGTKKPLSENQRLLTILSKMMYVAGDDRSPKSDCTKFLLRIVHSELLKMLREASKSAQTRGDSKKIDVVDLVFQFRRHPVLLRRLMNYLKSKEEVKKRNKSAAADLNELKSYASGEKKEEPDGPFVKALKVAVSKFDVYGTLTRRCEAEKFNDRDKFRRDWYASERIRQMNTLEYKYYSSARCFTFCNSPGLAARALAQKKFIEWLDPSLKITSIATLVLNFCASELVKLVVWTAVISKKLAGGSEEKKETFRDRVKYKVLGIKRRNAIPYLFYSEALRRLPRRGKPGFRGCVLFAYY